MGEPSLPRPSVQAAIIVALSLASFVSALGGEFVTDDRILVAEAGDLSDALGEALWHGADNSSSWYIIAYRPVVQVAYALERAWFGLDPGPYHLVNLLLHATNAVLVWHWLRRRFAASSHAGAPAAGAALLGAALFAVHPTHAENVAWISGATDLWMLLFWLASFALVERGGLLSGGLGLLCAALAVLAKEPAAVAPVVLAGDLWGRAGGMTRARARAVGLSLAGTGLALGVLGAAALSRPGVSERAGFRLLAPFGLTTDYLQAALWPVHLNVQVQTFWGASGQIGGPRVWLGVAIWAGVVALVVAALRHSALRPYVADLGWFFLPLLPPLLLLQEVRSDRFLYAPSVGLSALIARLVLDVARRVGAPRVAWVVAAGAVLPVVLLPLSVSAARAYLTNEDLWRSQIAAYPSHSKGYDGVGEELARQGNIADARAIFIQGLERAIEAKERTQVVHLCLHLLALDVVALPGQREDKAAEVEAAYGRLFDDGRLACRAGRARVDLPLTQREQREVRADAPLGLSPYAAVLLTRGKVAEAARAAEEALAHQPGLVAAHGLRAQALALSGRFDEAIAHLTGTAFSQRGQQALAPVLEHILQAKQLQDDPAPTPRARALRDARVALLLGSPPLAREALQREHAQAPADPELVQAYAQTYVSEGRFDQASRVLEQALAQAPEDPHLRGLMDDLDAVRREAQPARPEDAWR